MTNTEILRRERPESLRTGLRKRLVKQQRRPTVSCVRQAARLAKGGMKPNAKRKLEIRSDRPHAKSAHLELNHGNQDVGRCGIDLRAESELMGNFRGWPVARGCTTYSSHM